MVSRQKKQNEELESQLLGLLKDTIGGMDRKVTKESKRNNRQDTRLDKLDAAVFPKVAPIQNLPPPWKDPKNFRIILWIVLALIALALAFKGIDISKVFS